MTQVKLEAHTKSTSSPFWNPGIAHTKTGANLESLVIVRTSQRPESVPMMRHCFRADGPSIMLKPNRGVSRGPSTTLGSSLTAAATSFGLGFLFRFILSRTIVAVH